MIDYQNSIDTVIHTKLYTTSKNPSSPRYNISPWVGASCSTTGCSAMLTRHVRRSAGIIWRAACPQFPWSPPPNFSPGISKRYEALYPVCNVGNLLRYADAVELVYCSHCQICHRCGWSHTRGTGGRTWWLQLWWCGLAILWGRRDLRLRRSCLKTCHQERNAPAETN